MLTICRPHPATFCDRFTRRDVLRAGALALGGLTLADVLRLRAESATGSAIDGKRQKSVIMIYLHGGPSQLDMYDMKPGAPREYRGDFNPIRTNVPGIEICELMPLQAKIADKFAILRGLQTAPFHSGNEFYSGSPWQEFPRASIPGEARRPAFGSMLSRLRAADDSGSGHSAVIPYVSVGNPPDWEQAYYAGAEFEPVRLQVAASAEALDNMTRHHTMSLGRLDDRRNLLKALDRRRRELDIEVNARKLNSFQAKALDIIASGKVRDAFDLEKEPASVRARYGEGNLTFGLHPGKPLLQARRLVEAGVSVVTTCVYGWDTHTKNFTALRELLPPLDRAVHALVTDLADRGLLDDVTVVMGGEFGRTPKIGDVTPDGRGHWSDAAFLWMAGGGLKTGQTIGATDARAERSTGTPIKMQSVLATLYHVLGIDPATTIRDHNGRPQYLLDHRDTIGGVI